MPQDPSFYLTVSALALATVGIVAAASLRGFAAGWAQAQLHRAHLKLVGQPARQVGQCLQQREAFHLEPETLVHLQR